MFTQKSIFLHFKSSSFLSWNTISLITKKTIKSTYFNKITIYIKIIVPWYLSINLIYHALHSSLYWQKSYCSKCLGIYGSLENVSVHHDIVFEHTVRRFIFTGNLKTNKNILKHQVSNNEKINVKLQIWIAMTEWGSWDRISWDRNYYFAKLIRRSKRP